MAPDRDKTKATLPSLPAAVLYIRAKIYTPPHLWPFARVEQADGMHREAGTVRESSPATSHGPPATLSTAGPKCAGAGREGQSLTAGFALAVGGRHPEVRGAGVEHYGELLGWGPNVDLPKVLALQTEGTECR